MCACCRTRKNSYPDYYEPKEKMKCWKKTLIILAIVILSLIIIGLILFYVGVPLYFMNSISMQRFFMFINIDNPKNPEFDKPEKYEIKGVINYYLTTNDYDTNGTEKVKIGLWFVKPEADINNLETDITKILKESRFPILFYLHGVACNRILPQNGYRQLRKHFLMIGVDYRGYGDSSNTPLTENGIIHDNLQLYLWVKERTSQDIYIWGHSLGAAISTHTVRTLKEEKNIVPTGLVLESPFTTMRDEVLSNPVGKIWSWLPYFEATVLNPLAKNGFLFETVKNILFVDCPIMIMIAEDDDVIPFEMGRKVAEIATNERNPGTQGNVTYHQYARLGYKHNDVLTDAHTNEYVTTFIKICQEWKDSKNIISGPLKVN